MSQEMIFDDEEKFIAELKSLVQSKGSSEGLTVFAPYPIHGLEEVMKLKPSKLKFFTLTGTLSGATTGFLFAGLTSWVWPLVTSGKPIISIPAFIVIAFELNILFGALVSMLGFLILARLPNLKHLLPEKEYGNKFVIVQEKGN